MHLLLLNFVGSLTHIMQNTKALAIKNGDFLETDAHTHTHTPFNCYFATQMIGTCAVLYWEFIVLQRVRLYLQALFPNCWPKPLGKAYCSTATQLPFITREYYNVSYSQCGIALFRPLEQCHIE